MARGQADIYKLYCRDFDWLTSRGLNTNLVASRKNPKAPYAVVKVYVFYLHYPSQLCFFKAILHGILVAKRDLTHIL